ncbi:AMP-binding protein [Stutzerimonas stutzeri]|uniref:AMP-binding protein n=1 Tax=Stutzerimonas stutzeri TaxID=316 RepID=UPI003C6EF703
MTAATTTRTRRTPDRLSGHTPTGTRTPPGTCGTPPEPLAVPRGVIQTFRMMMSNYLNIGLAVDLTGQDTLLNVLPLFHTAGLNLYSSAVFLAGGTVLAARTFEPDQAMDVLENRPTIFFGVPAVYQAILDHPSFSGDRFAQCPLLGLWRRTLGATGGSPVYRTGYPRAYRHEDDRNRPHRLPAGRGRRAGQAAGQGAGKPDNRLYRP